ncbi:MAG: hypothetical protein SFU91_12350 [Chloroherpetonaceae bacterium]|nr:hypothetical protein [Chloroherpetonaceae bacterium]
MWDGSRKEIIDAALQALVNLNASVSALPDNPDEPLSHSRGDVRVFWGGFVRDGENFEPTKVTKRIRLFVNVRAHGLSSDESSVYELLDEVESAMFGYEVHRAPFIPVDETVVYNFQKAYWVGIQEYEIILDQFSINSTD